MKDPHVASMTYVLKIGRTVELPDDLHMQIHRPQFNAQLDGKQLIINFIDHYDSEESAKEVSDIFVKSWEIDISLDFGPDTVVFKYDSCNIIDRNPDPNTTIIALKGIVSATAFGKATLISKWTSFPTPSDAFTASPDVETMFLRYKMYKENKESLENMAYFCLTMLERKEYTNEKGDLITRNKREVAADFYNIKKVVLDKLGCLTSEKGKRKAFQPPLSPRERKWIETTIKSLIKQCGMVDSGFKPDCLEMGNLPSLEE